LFLTPKFLADGEDGLGARNAVHCDGIEHKMGIRGSATCTMRFDGATGYMVGRPNRGLQAMFTMMNYERIAVGLQGLGAGELGYQYAAAHASERRQGRALDGPVDPDAPADTLLVHPDVRRMLLTQRAYNEAGRAFVTYLSMQADTAKYEEDKDVASKADRLLSLLTPISKAFMSDLGFEGCVAAQQVFGGAGYVGSSGIEQIVRDARIAQIYEGANGVIAMDLLGRRVMPDGGAMVDVLLDEIESFCDHTADDPWTKAQVAALRPAAARMREVTRTVVGLAQQPFNGADEIGAAAYPYLQALGHVAYAYMWARMTDAVSGKNTDFAEAKRQTGRFFITHLLPRFDAACAGAEAGAQPIMGLSAEAF
ncbi:MAG: acyl-CoA dehydrogenase, partial [Pseudomonadota bacterium]